MFNLPLDQAQIRELIPHAGSMCLLHEVLNWNDALIECSATSHRDLENPLRHTHMLPAHAGIEYCAQAIAIHGRLLAIAENCEPSQPPQRGYLAVILQTEWRIARLDECTSPLQICATQQVRLQQGVSYSFAIKHEGHSLLTGQAVVALEGS